MTWSSWSKRPRVWSRGLPTTPARRGTDRLADQWMIILYACLVLVLMHALLPGSDLRRLGQFRLRHTWLGVAGPGRARSS